MTSPAGGAFWNGRPVLVTGATGFMGGWLTRSLVERGADVVVLVRDRSPRSLLVRDGWLSRLTVVSGVVEDRDLLRRTMAEYDVDTVFHLAAQPLVGVAKVDPVGTLEVNVRGTWNVLEAARLAPARQIVVASSDKAYGESASLPYRETDPLRGQYPYDVSKSCADLICGMYARTYGQSVAVTRCANVFGGGDFNLSRTIPGVIRSTHRGERFVVRSDGQFVRDLLYAADAAAAYLLLAERLTADPGLRGEAFNFGLGVRLTVLDLVRKVLELMDRSELEPVILNQASAEIREQYLDCDKAHRVLRWAPAWSLDEALRETIAWYVALYEGRLGGGRDAG